MYSVVFVVMVIDSGNYIAFFYNNDRRDPMKENGGEYYGSEKDVDVDAAVGFTRA